MNDKSLGNLQTLAGEIVGKRILVGITYLNADDEVDRLVQIHGLIVSFDDSEMMVRLQGLRDGEMFSLPPDLRAIRQIEHARFTLRATGEVVENPDLLGEWTIRSCR